MPVFHYPDVHTARCLEDKTARTFEIPLSSARATPPCPGSRAFFWGLTPLWGSDPWCNPLMAHSHPQGHVHSDADARRLGMAFALILVFMVAEVVAGILGSSLALL